MADRPLPADETARDPARALPRAGGSFFGRRKAKKLRPGQADLFERLLPALSLPENLPVDLTTLFPDAVREVRLEIGFGGGEHLLAAALAEPDVGFVGCEPFINGMAKLLSAVNRGAVSNIRLWTDDAAPLLARFAPGSLARVDLFYPDPWPKRRQRKRRFVSDRTLAAIARVLPPGGQFRFATDIDDYAGWTLARLARQSALTWSPQAAADWLTPHQGWVRTRYEAKALLAGRTPTYLTAVRSAA
jgi:tRNA (guanine-N7-)-methyltransferase